MVKRTFFYDLASKDWKECTDPEYIQKEMEELPVHLLVYRHEKIEPPPKLVWCPQHQAYETVSRCHDFSLETSAGCKLQGIIVSNLHMQGDKPPKTEDLTLCWQVSWQKDKSTVLVTRFIPQLSWPTTKDKVAGDIVRIPHIRYYRSECLTIHFSRQVMLPKDSGLVLPDPIADAALELLAMAAEKEFGKRPVLPTHLHAKPFEQGMVRLKAFLHHPLDMNLWILQNFFADDSHYKDLFSSRTGDTFPKLCYTLELTPSNFLKKWHEKSPYALISASLLLRMGIRTPKFIQPFLYLPDSPSKAEAKSWQNILRSYNYHASREATFTPDIFADDDNVRIMLLLCGWYIRNPLCHNLVFYCQWRLFHTDEEQLASHLMVLLKNWGPWCPGFLECFCRHYTDIPLEIRHNILQEGPTPDSEAMIADAVKDAGRKDFFSHTAAQKAYACEIDGFEFRLISSSDEFRIIMNAESYRHIPDAPSFKDDGILRMGMFRQGCPVACIVLHSTFRIIHNCSGGAYGHALHSACIRIAVLHWLKWTGLYKNYGPYFESDYEFLTQNVIAKPLPESSHIKEK